MTSPSPDRPISAEQTDKPSAAVASALGCLAEIGRQYSIDIDPESIKHQYALSDERIRPQLIARIAGKAGLSARVRQLSWDKLSTVTGPVAVLAFLNNRQVVILRGIERRDGREFAVVFDPMTRRRELLLVDRPQFEGSWTGEIVIARKRVSLGDETRPFGLGWFVPHILSQKRLFIDIILGALALQVISLATPIFFQVVIDKALPHLAYATLLVLMIGMVVAVIFDGLITYLRSYLLLIASRRIDVVISARTFQHLVSLPLPFFQNTLAGVINRNMLEANNIREFLTGRVLSTALDGFSLLVLLPILFFYSWQLSLMVMFFALATGAVLAGMSPVFQRKLKELYGVEGQRQGLLVEAIHGVNTIKSLALEPIWGRKWNEISAEAVLRHLDVGQTANIARAVTNFFQRLMTVLIIGIGAYLVFQDQLTVGALVAFNMMSGRVTGPLVQLVSMIQEYQRTLMSVKLVGLIMNAPPEANRGRLRPPVRGRIDFQDVVFRYPGAPRPTLDRISLAIPEGASVGVVGKSGSGKTTLTRLVQGLYPVESGIIRFDGIDLREIELSHLRSNLGVVLQENLLFRATVRENISLSKPTATLQEIVQASQLAGAHEFIEQLPQGYDTILEESASNLSGGQRQRLAIARALLRTPPILIFDEATSSLDPDSEAAILENLAGITRDRTSIIVSHRLSMVRDADMIIVLDEGKIADVGAHDALVGRCAIYKHLWTLQTKSLH